MNKYGLKNRIRICNAIDIEIYKKITDYSKETGIPMSKLLDKSIEMFLKDKKIN